MQQLSTLENPYSTLVLNLEIKDHHTKGLMRNPVFNLKKKTPQQKNKTTEIHQQNPTHLSNSSTSTQQTSISTSLIFFAVFDISRFNC